MSSPEKLHDEALRLLKAADEVTQPGEKRMLENQATFYEVIAAQEDAVIEDHDRERPAKFSSGRIQEFTPRH